MYTEQELTEALLAADKAGDTQAATLLVAEIDKLRAPPPKDEPKEEGWDFANIHNLGGSLSQGWEAAKAAGHGISTLLLQKGVEISRQRGDAEAEQRALGGMQSHMQGMVDATTTMSQGYQNPALKEVAEAPTLTKGLHRFVRDPVEITIHAIASNAPQLAASVVTALVTRHTQLTMAVAGSAGAAMEFGNSILQYASDNGVRITDKKAVEAFFNDPVVLDKAVEYATKRTAWAVPGDIILGHALTKGLRGVPLGTSRASHAAKAAAEAGVAGVGSETAAQLAVGEWKPGEVIIEGVAGAGLAGPVAASAGRKEQEAPPEQTDVLDRLRGLPVRPEPQTRVPPNLAADAGLTTRVPPNLAAEAGVVEPSQLSLFPTTSEQPAQQVTQPQSEQVGQLPLFPEQGTITVDDMPASDPAYVAAQIRELESKRRAIPEGVWEAQMRELESQTPAAPAYVVPTTTAEEALLNKAEPEAPKEDTWMFPESPGVRQAVTDYLIDSGRTGGDITHPKTQAYIDVASKYLTEDDITDIRTAPVDRNDPETLPGVRLRNLLDERSNYGWEDEYAQRITDLSSKESADNRAKALRMQQLAKADALDGMADTRDLTEDEIMDLLFPRDTENPASEPGQTGGVEQRDPSNEQERERFINTMIDGQRKAQRNAELSSVLEAVRNAFDKASEDTRILTDLLINAVKLIESFGIHTKVDFVPSDQYQNLFDLPNQRSFGNIISRLPNANRPEGSLVVSLRHETKSNLVDGMKLDTLLHEATHAATMGIIKLVTQGKITDPKIVKAVQDLVALKDQLFADWKDKRLTDPKVRKHIGAITKSPEEFVAYAMTSPSLQVYLRATPDRRSPLRKVWDSFVKAVLMAIGADTSVPVSMYESTLNAFSTIVRAQTQSPESAKAWLKEVMRDPAFAAQGETAETVFTQEQVTNIREQAEANHHRRNPDHYIDPYGAFEDITRGNIPEGYVFHGMEEGELFSGQVPQEPNGVLNAPYVLIVPPSRQGYYVVVNVPSSPLYFALKARFPGYHIMTPSQAESFLRTETTMDELAAQLTAQANDNNVTEALGDLFSPESKLLQPFTDIHTVEEAIVKQAMEGKDMPTNLFDFVTGGPNAQAVLFNNPLLRFVRHSVHNIVRAQSKMARQTIHPMSQVWFSMSESDRVLAMQIAIEQDERQQDFTIGELASAGASSQVIDLLGRMRQAMDVSLDHWNSERAKLGLPAIPRREGYFPSLFFGDYRSIVRDEQGEVIGLVAAGTEVGLNLKKKKILERFNVTFDPMIRIGMERKNPYSESSWSFLEAISNYIRHPNQNAEIVNEFSDFLQTLSIDDARHILGFSRHEKYKKGIWGGQGRDPTEDAQANAHHAFQAMVTYLEDGANHHAQMSTLNDMAKITTDPGMRRDSPNTVQYIEDLYQHISRRKSPTGNESRQGALYHNIGRGIDTIIDGALKMIGIGPNGYRKGQALLRSIFSSNVMGFLNLPFTFLQVMQVVQCGPQAASYLRKATGLGIASPRARLASTEAVVGVTRLFMDFMSTKYHGKPINGYNWFGGDQDTRDALNYAMENNLITLNDLELAHSAMLTPFQRKADVVININQRAAEAATRPLVFMWMYNILKNSNLPKARQYEIARNATNFVMAEYHSTARPMIYQAVGTSGPLLGQLKTFAHSYAGQQVFWGKTALKGEAVGPFIAMLVAYTLYVGVDDMPIYDELDTLTRLTTRGFKGMGFEVEEVGHKDFITPYLPDMLKYGLLSHYTGIDFQKRLRMPPLIQDEFLANAPALNWLTDITSDHLDLVVESWKIGDVDKTRLKKAQHGVAPSSLKGPLEHLFYKEDDLAESTKDMMGRWTHRNERDWTLRWMGLRSLEDTLRKEMVQGLRAKQKEADERKREISAEYTESMVTERGMTIDRYHKLRAEYISLGGKSEELDAKVQKAKEDLAKGETMKTLEKNPKERSWLFYQESRR